MIATRTIAGTGPTMVFLHEGVGSIPLWRDIPDQLARLTGFPALIYDRPGYGKSPPVPLPRPLSYMHDDAAQLPAILDGIADPILIGHSDGASIAIIATGQRLVTPRALVLIGAHVFVEEVSVSSITAAAVDYQTGTLRARLAKYHDDVDTAFWGWNRAWLDPAFRVWNLETFLPAITAPTLIIQGEQDEFGTRAQVDAIARGVSGPVEIAMIPNAGHSPHRSPAAADVVARIAAFVTSSR